MEIDTTYVQQVRQDYDYLSEIYEEANPTPTVSSPEYTLPSGLGDALFVFGLLLLVAFLAWFVVKKVSNMQGDAFKEDDIPAGMGKDTIYKHNWKEEVEAALKARNFDEAAVLGYLYWLHRLNKMKAIKFSESKTPGIFLQEVDDYVMRDKAAQNGNGAPSADAVADPLLLSNTQSLTNDYLYVRYGHRHINEAKALEILKLAGLC